MSGFGDKVHAGMRGLGRGFAGAVGGLGGFSRERTGTTGFFDDTMYYAGRAVRGAAGFTKQGLGYGFQGAKWAGRGFRDFRANDVSSMKDARWTADFIEKNGPGIYPSDPSKIKNARLRGRSADEVVKKYGRQEDGFRRFGARSPGEHLKKGFHNLFNPKYGIYSPMSIGINLGLATMMTDDNIFHPHNGIAKHMGENVGAEVGFVGPGAIGASIAAAFMPAAAIAGFIGGGLIGADMGAKAANLPWTLSKFGHTYGKGSVNRKSQFHDSEYAATMRQRAMQSISRNQMSARSAFGQEALAYHA